MDAQMTVGQTAVMEMSSDLCDGDGCDDVDTLATGCTSVNLSCVQASAAAIAGSGLTSLRPVSVQLAPGHQLYSGLSPAPELQPPRALLRV
jgi:hypothetical protein